MEVRQKSRDFERELKECSDEEEERDTKDEIKHHERLIAKLSKDLDL